MEDTVNDGPVEPPAEHSPQSVSAEPPADAQPKVLGRYRIDRVLGAGMMGVVFEAFDPELEQRRAIKLMQPGAGRDRAKSRQRFLREAKAMAKLSHPNVVAVYDVGTHRDRPFVVMEFVEGSTLEEWNRRNRPPWREVLETFRKAGRGLAAAHDAGLVHRDFKPANVLVARDGAVKVTDFGLVRAAEEAEVAELEPIAGTIGDDVGPDELTRTGALMGTPAYMAPEQARRRTSDARSDQFAFCVSLYEAIYRQRPFAGGTLDEIAAAAEAGKLRRPEGTEVDEWVFEALARGLDPDPEKRWPEMSSLIARLDPFRRRRARRLALAVGTVVLVGAAAIVFVARDDLLAWWSPVTVEAELAQAQIEAPMVAAVDPDVGPYASSDVANKGRVTFAVDVPQSGRYFAWGLVWEEHLGGDRGDADSFFVYIDQGEEQLWHFGCENEKLGGVERPGHWRWQRIHDMPNADSDCELRSLDFHLSRGHHRIVVRNRESANGPGTAARVARLVLTNDAGYEPK
jgi:predicted Ser/Thr protein kinase